LDELGQAVAAHIIAEVAGAVGRYKFCHALIRESLYGALMPANRVRLHCQIGEVLEAIYGANQEPHSAELAHHFLRAAAGGDIEKALHHATRAGERASALLAYEDAVTHYERALQALDIWKPADEARRCELLLALGEAHMRAGADAARKQAFQRAADLARKLESAEQFARAVLGLGSIELSFENERLVHLLEEALGVLDPQDSSLRAKLLGLLSAALYWSDEQGQRLSLSQEAVEMARRVGDRLTLAFALHARAYGLSGPGEVEARCAITTEFMQLAEQARDREMVLWSRSLRIADLLVVGDLPTMNREIDTFGRQAQELRQPYFLWRDAVFRTMQAGLQGRLDDYERQAQEALRVGQRATESEALIVFGCQMFELNWTRGRLGELEGVIQALADRPGPPAFLFSYQAILATLYAEEGRHAEAQAVFDSLAGGDFSALPRNDDWLSVIALLAFTCTFLRDAPRAAVLYDLIRPYAPFVITAGKGALCSGSASYFLGLLATTMECWEDAERHFADALEMHTQIGAPHFLADTQCDYASMLLARGQLRDRGKAMELLERALDTAEQLGMSRLATRALALKAEADGVHAKDVEISAGVDTAAAATAGHAASAPAPLGPTPARRANIISFPTGGLRPRAGRVEEAAHQPDRPTQGGITGPPSGSVEESHREQTGLFRKDGEYWTIAYKGSECRLKDGLGLRYLARLLQYPGQEFIASELVAAVHGWHGTPASTGVPRGGADSPASVAGLGDAGEILDAEAKGAYKRRLHELREELEEAQAFHDVGRTERLQEEADVLARELATAVGLGGRSRRAASHVERARQNVTRRVKLAIRKIAEHNPALGRHLMATVKTGTFCSYVPDPRVPVSWEL
jgi:tetratricopeptide (TPR) repeat protein